MSTTITKIHVPDELKTRLTHLAKAEGSSMNKWVVDAIARKVGALEKKYFLHGEATEELVGMWSTGDGVAMDDMNCYRDVRRTEEAVAPDFPKQHED